MTLRILNDDETAMLREQNPGVNFNVNEWCPTCKKNDDCHYRYKGKRVACDCEQQMMLYKHYLASGIGKGYHRLGWGDFQRSAKVKADLNKYLERHVAYVDEGMGFVFTGDFGTGKTMLATLILKDLIQIGYRCYATSAADTTTNLTAGWRDKKDRRRYEDIYVNSQILLLDDVGRDLIEDRTGEIKESGKFKESVLDTILRTRVQFARPTFITTNLEPRGLEEGYGGAVHSLISQNSIVVELAGEDFRGQVAKQKLDLIERGERAPIV